MMQEPYKTLHHFRKSELRADRADPKKYSEIGEPLKKKQVQFETI